MAAVFRSAQVLKCAASITHHGPLVSKCNALAVCYRVNFAMCAMTAVHQNAHFTMCSNHCFRFSALEEKQDELEVKQAEVYAQDDQIEDLQTRLRSFEEAGDYQMALKRAEDEMAELL